LVAGDENYLVVPVSPGGALDTLARLLGEQIRHAQGVTMLVENRSVAGGAIAAEAVSRAAPDGNTLMMVSPDLLATSQLRNLNYDLRLEPVCYLVSVPNVIAVNGASSYWTLADLLNAARGQPGAVGECWTRARSKSRSRNSSAQRTSK
jgi:tripartite-type tricarboxylate transporter receptor subunit TctC